MPKKSNFPAKLAETLAVRDQVKLEFIPLFDHLIKLAKNSLDHNYPQSAGRELQMARNLVRKYGAR
jgi:hypothetical protein